MSGSFFGSYQLLGELYRDRTGVVYRAHCPIRNRPFAIKVLLRGTAATPIDRQRFLREARAMASCEHPQLPQIYEVGESNGLLYLVQQLLEGGSLADRLLAGRLPPLEAVRLVALIAGAADHVHQRGLLHRDITPANILLDGTGDTPLEECRPYLAGFGLCRLRDDLTPTPGQQTPTNTPAHDIWGLGATLYECLTGRPPFQGANDDETFDLILHAPPPPMRSLVPDLPQDLEGICLRCLEKEPQRRYASAAELAAVLERWRSETPRSSLWRRLWP
jgi:serine/threonine-protein kinase